MQHSLFAAFSCLLAALPAQDKAPSPAELRVHVIGASVSGGFRDTVGTDEHGDTITMQQLLRPWAADGAKVTTHNTLAMLTMFLDPLGTGQDQIARARRAEPDVVVAIDFPFWFGYGYVDGGADEAEVRTAKLEQGLAMLAELTMPVLIGDLPDMTGAERRMLSPRQIPSPEVLAQLNAQIAEFAKAHDNVRLVPLADVVHRMRTEGVELPLADGSLPTKPGALQQADKLHANRLGMAYLGYRMQEALRSAFPVGHPLAERRWTFEQWVEAARAEGDLELLRQAAAVAK